MRWKIALASTDTLSTALVVIAISPRSHNHFERRSIVTSRTRPRVLFLFLLMTPVTPTLIGDPFIGDEQPIERQPLHREAFAQHRLVRFHPGAHLRVVGMERCSHHAVFNSKGDRD